MSSAPEFSTQTNEDKTMQAREQPCAIHSRSVFRPCIGIASLGTASLGIALACGSALAEPVEFADDFSADSLRFSVDRRANERVVRAYDVRDDRIVMTVAATSAENSGEGVITVYGRSDSITTRVSLDSAELAVDPDAEARVRIAGQFWNYSADGGTDGQIDDTYLQLRVRRRGDGSGEASLCVDRTTSPDGSEGEGVPLFEGGADCDRFPDFVPELGVEYTLSVSVDRAAGVLTYSIDDTVRSVSLGQPVFLPALDVRRVEARQSGPPGEMVASVHAIGTDDYLQDFTTERPAIGPYRPFFDLEGERRSLSVVDGRARFEVASQDGGNERLSVPVQGESDRIEATLELSSESTLVEGTGDVGDTRLLMTVGGTFYNDIAEGGIDGSEGHVFAAVDLFQDADATLGIVYCIFRSNVADFSDAVALLEQGEDECMDSGIDVAFDTAYPASVALDRDAGTLTFTAGENEFVYPIATPIFSVPEGDQFIRARARAWNGSTTIGFIDDYRTSADAPLVSPAGSPVDPAIDPMTGTDGSTPDTTTDPQGGDETPVGTDDTDAADGGSGGGGGCSIGGTGGDGTTWLLGLFAAAALGLRRRTAQR